MVDNLVRLTGNITDDPDLRFSAGGKAFAKFTIVHNQRIKNERGEWADGDSSFFDVTCFGDYAEHAAESLAKGHRVTVIGKLSQDKWEDKDTGQPRSKVVILADSVSADLRWATATITKAGKSA